MVSSRQLKIPLNRGIGHHSGGCFGALAQVIGRTAVLFLRNMSPQLQNAWMLTCSKLLCQELQMLLVVENFLKQLQRLCEDKPRENTRVVVAEKRLQAKSFQESLRNKPREMFSLTFSLMMSNHFRYQRFVAVSGKQRKKDPLVDAVLWPHHLEKSPSTSLEDNCIEFETQTNQNCYVDLRQTYVALKMIFVKSRGEETFKVKAVKKEHKKTKADVETKEEDEAPVPLVVHVNKI